MPGGYARAFDDIAGGHAAPLVAYTSGEYTTPPHPPKIAPHRTGDALPQGAPGPQEASPLADLGVGQARSARGLASYGEGFGM